MEGRNFIDTAKILLKKDSPANYRTAFSRAYYASYNTGVELFEKAGITIIEGPGGHEQVSRYLQNCGIQELAEVGSKIGTLYTDRIKADYRLNNNIVEKRINATLAVAMAETIINSLDLHFSNSATEIRKGIEEYNDKINLT